MNVPFTEFETAAAQRAITAGRHDSLDEGACALELAHHVVDGQTVIQHLGAEWSKRTEPFHERVIEIEKTACDQPGCPKQAVGRYRFKELFSRGGERLDPTDGTHANKYHIKFCREHLRRGDCDREDSDDNYEPLDGDGPESAAVVIESPSQFGGVIVLTGATEVEP